MAIRQSASGAIRGLGLCQSNAISTGGTMAIRESNPRQYNANWGAQTTAILCQLGNANHADTMPIRQRNHGNWRVHLTTIPMPIRQRNGKPCQFVNPLAEQFASSNPMPIPCQFGSTNHSKYYANSQWRNGYKRRDGAAGPIGGTQEGRFML